FPAIEKRAKGDAPVTVEPCPDELLRAGGPQPLLVRLNVNVLVVVDLRRNEHPFEPGHRIADDAVAQGGRIDVARLHPLVPRPPGFPVARKPTGTPAPERSVAINFITGAGLGKFPTSST